MLAPKGDAFLREIRASEPWLFEDPATEVLASREYPEYGDAVVELSNRNLRIRVVRDRQDVFIDVGSRSEPEAWWELVNIMQKVAGTPPRKEPTRENAFRNLQRVFGSLQTALSGSRAELERRLGRPRAG